jgi:signal transduction histidine kinase
MATRDLDVGPVLVIPLLGSQRTWGVLTTARRAGRTAFSGDDLDMASSFANQATIALELAEARAEQQRAAMLDERDRIAADLHDQVIQRLFAAGLSLQSVLGRLDPGLVSTRITETIRNLDETTSQIRTTIFGLHQPPQGGGGGTRARLLDVVHELTPALGFTPSLRFTGALDDTVSPQLGEDVVAVVREALSNVARHAHAHQAEIDIRVHGGQLTVRVADDGVGAPTDNSRSSGLTNLRERAARHGGTFTLTPREPAGCLLTWTVPTA